MKGPRCANPPVDVASLESVVDLDSLPSAREARNAFRRALNHSDRAERLAAVSDFTDTVLAKYRIIEWEFLVLRLVESRQRGILDFEFASEIRSVADYRERESWRVLQQAGRASISSSPHDQATQGFMDALRSFNGLGPKHVRTEFPRTFDKAFHAVAGTDTASASLLIEDGELTFFSLLWLFRNVPDAIAWLKNPSTERPARFAFIDGKPLWIPVDLRTLGEMCGIVVPADENKVSLAPRWLSLMGWLASEHRFNASPGPSHAASQASQLVTEIATCLGTKCDAPPTASRNCTVDEFASYLVRLLGPFEKILRRNGPPDAHRNTSWRDHDPSLIEAARSPFLPWEFLLRSWQPYPLSLLIVPSTQVPSPLSDHLTYERMLPHTVALATVAGAIPPPGSRADWTQRYTELLGDLADVWAVEIAVHAASKVSNVGGEVRTFLDRLPTNEELHGGTQSEAVTNALTMARDFSGMTFDSDAEAHVVDCLKRMTLRQNATDASKQMNLTVLGMFLIFGNAVGELAGRPTLQIGNDVALAKDAVLASVSDAEAFIQLCTSARKALYYLAFNDHADMPTSLETATLGDHGTSLVAVLGNFDGARLIPLLVSSLKEGDPPASGRMTTRSLFEFWRAFPEASGFRSTKSCVDLLLRTPTRADENPSSLKIDAQEGRKLTVTFSAPVDTGPA